MMPGLGGVKRGETGMGVLRSDCAMDAARPHTGDGMEMQVKTVHRGVQRGQTGTGEGGFSAWSPTRRGRLSFPRARLSKTFPFLQQTLGGQQFGRTRSSTRVRSLRVGVQVLFRSWRFSEER